MSKPSSSKEQSDKFKALARELECDEDEAAFDEKLKRVAKQEPPQKDGGSRQRENESR